MQESLGLPDNNRNSAIVIKRVEKTTRFFLQLQPHLIPSFRDLCTSGNLSDYSLQTVFRCERTVCCLLFEIPIRIINNLRFFAFNSAIIQCILNTNKSSVVSTSRFFLNDEKVNVFMWGNLPHKLSAQYLSKTTACSPPDQRKDRLLFSFMTASAAQLPVRNTSDTAW
jgi:hypothetical protein